MVGGRGRRAGWACRDDMLPATHQAAVVACLPTVSHNNKMSSKKKKKNAPKSKKPGSMPSR